MIEKYNPAEIQITFTDAAMMHFQSSLKKDSKAIGIYLGTKKAGCSGYAYVAELAYTTDHTIQAKTNAPFHVYVASDSLSMLQELVIDIEQKALGQKMVIYKNPNEAARCGCGESFMPKKQA